MAPGPAAGPGRRGPLWLWLLVAALAVTALVLYLATRFPEALRDEENRMSLVASLLWLGLLGASLVVHIRAKPGHALRGLAIWTAIALVLLALYAYRHEFARLKDRVLGDLLPHQGQTAGAEASVAFRARADGHFVIEAEVNGTRVRFLVDTGASDVVLSPADAQRLGFDLAKLDYSRRYNTANGVVLGAPVRLKRVAVGPIALQDVRASVNAATMSHSLLGMSFLGRLSGYEVKDSTLVLRR
jgi:aspartyl protease family protein